MLSNTPPAKSARTQRLGNSQLRFSNQKVSGRSTLGTNQGGSSVIRPSGGALGGGNNSLGAGGTISGTAVAFDYDEISHFGVGESMAWVLNKEDQIACGWGTLGISPLNATFQLPNNAQADEEAAFVAEGFDGKSILTCSVSGKVAFPASAASRTGSKAFQILEGSSNGAVKHFVSIPSSRRVVLALTCGELIVAQFTAANEVAVISRCNVVGQRVKKSGGASTSNNNGGGEENDGNNSGWFSWLGMSSKKKRPSQNLDDSSTAADVEGTNSSSPSSAQIITDVTYSQADNDVIFVSTFDDSVHCYRVNTSGAQLNHQWSVAAATSGMRIVSLCATEKELFVLHNSFATAQNETTRDNAHTAVSEQHRPLFGFVTILAIEDGHHVNRVPFSIPADIVSSSTSSSNKAGGGGGPLFAADTLRMQVLANGSLFAAAVMRRCIVWIPLMSSPRSTSTVELQHTDQDIICGGVCQETLTVLTSRGPSSLVAPAQDSQFAAQDLRSGAAIDPILAAVSGDRDINAACLAVCDDIINDVRENPANWARKELDADDVNILTFVTKQLISRQQRHRALLESVFNEPAVASSLAPETYAEMVSQQERLVALATIRNLQNNTSQNDRLDVDVGRLIKEAIVAVADGIREELDSTSPQQSLSSAELVFASDSTVVGLLMELNQIHETTALAQETSLQQKLQEAVAITTIFAAVCEAVEMSRRDLPVSAEAESSLWTCDISKFSFLDTLNTQMMANSETIKLSMTWRNHSAQLTTDEGTTLLDSLELELLKQFKTIIQFLFRYHPLGDMSSYSDSLRATLFCHPFFEGGYPHCNPRAVPHSPIADEVSKFVVEISKTFQVCDVLCDLSLGTLVKDFSRDAKPTYSYFNELCKDNEGLFEFALGWLLHKRREEEVKNLYRVCPNVPNGENILNVFLEKKAPAFNWVLEDRNKKVEDRTAYRSLVKASRETDVQVPFADNIVDHRHRTLALAKLAWVVEGRPNAMKHVMNNDLAIVKAQKQFLPHAQEEMWDSRECVGALLQNFSAHSEDDSARAGLVAASKIADTISNDTERIQLLSECASAAFRLDDTKNQLAKLRNGAEGEAEMVDKISKTLLAQVIHNSGALKGALLKSSGFLKDTIGDGPEFAMMHSWGKAKYL